MIFARKPCGGCFLTEGRLYEVAVQTRRLRIQTLKALSNCSVGVLFRGPDSLYLKPKTLDEAVTLLATPGDKYCPAGRTFIRRWASGCRGD